MRNIRSKLVIFGVSLFALIGVMSVSAQNVNEEYREWQNAQRDAQEEYQDYLRTRRASDYRDWQQAQRRAQQEYAEYQQAQADSSYGRVYNNNYRRVYNNNNYGNYRYYRNGRLYRVDNRGAELLRSAVQQGYQQGYLEGQRDREYGNRYNYRDERTYQMGTYGYQSYGVAQSQYQYYFQQGFQRGYQDGFYSRNQYGYRSGSSVNILGTILNGILNLTRD